MRPITIHPESKEQIKVFEQMAKASKVPFEKVEVAANDDRSGEAFKQSVVNGQEAYKNGEMSEFVKIGKKEGFERNGGFMKRLKEALTIEEARELSIRHVKGLHEDLEFDGLNA